MKKQTKFAENCDAICKLNKQIEAEKDPHKKNKLLIELNKLERQQDKIAATA